MDTIKILLIIGFGIFAIAMLTFMSILSTMVMDTILNEHTTIEKEVDCYDRFGNKIEDLKCIDETYKSNENFIGEKTLFITSFLIWAILMISFIINDLKKY